MAKRKSTKKTKRISTKTTKQIVKVIVDNSKKSVRVNSSKPKTPVPASTYYYAYTPIRPSLSGLERTIYENEIQRLQNPLGVRIKTNPFVDVNGRSFNMAEVATQTPADPQLSPSTLATTGIEGMRNYLINNLSRIPTKKTYSEDDILKLQPNRISELYAETRQNILQAPQTPTHGDTQADNPHGDTPIPRRGPRRELTGGASSSGFRFGLRGVEGAGPISGLFGSGKK